MSTTSRWSSVSNAKTREKFGRHIVADFVDDSVGVLADTILLLARQLLGAGATRFVCQGIDASQNPGHILLRNTARSLATDFLKRSLYLPLRLQVFEELLVRHRGLVGSLIEGS
jgi:hypothetical protein